MSYWFFLNLKRAYVTLDNVFYGKKMQAPRPRLIKADARCQTQINLAV